MPPIFDVITKENITFLTALIGALGAIYTYIRQRKHLKICICKIENTDNGFFLKCILRNQSTLPLSITSIAIYEGGNPLKMTASKDPLPLPHPNGKTETDEIPFDIPSLSAKSIWLGVPLPDKFSLSSPTLLSFQFETTRGRIKIKGLPLSEVPHMRSRTS